MTASRRQPGILWTLNDSGHDAWIFAVDTLGRTQGAFQVEGGRNLDWEAISLGPCGRRDCLYIADTGDNAQDRRSATIYRVPEPALPAPRRRVAQGRERAKPRQDQALAADPTDDESREPSDVPIPDL